MSEILLGRWVPIAFCSIFIGGAFVGGYCQFQNRQAEKTAVSQLERGLNVLAVDTLESRRHALASDAQGWITFPHLVPGAPYEVVDFNGAMDDEHGYRILEFRVKPGEKLLLPAFPGGGH